MVSKNSERFPWHFTEFNYTFQFNGQTTILIVIFFSFILLIIFLYIYFHFLLTRYGHFSAHTATTTASTLSHSQASPIGLDTDTINSLPIFMHSSLLENPNFELVKEISECSICLGLFEDREIVKVLPICNHAYHSQCVDMWLTTHSSCPLCRASLQLDRLGWPVDSINT